MKLSTKALATVAIAAATLATAQSAAALTIVYNLGGAAGSAPSFTYAGLPTGGPSLTINGWIYDFAPNGLNGQTIGNAQFHTANIARDATGVGICAVTSPADVCTTVDTTPNSNDGNESLALNFGQSVTLQSVTVSGFQPLATLALWRQNADLSLTTVHTIGSQNTGLGSTSPLLINLAASNFSASTFALTNVNNNSLGYHVDQIVVSVADPTPPPSPAPEPATWAMMITGFGGVGALVRRRRSTLALVPVKA
jgi:hypothetical protein